jgi:hypothetical protein
MYFRVKPRMFSLRTIVLLYDSQCDGNFDLPQIFQLITGLVNPEQKFRCTGFPADFSYESMIGWKLKVLG